MASDTGVASQVTPAVQPSGGDQARTLVQRQDGQRKTWVQICQANLANSRRMLLHA
jgi:hypothetical protein